MNQQLHLINNVALTLVIVLFFGFNLPIQAQVNRDSLDYYRAKLDHKEKMTTDSVKYLYTKAKGFATAREKIYLLRTEAKYMKSQEESNAELLLYDEALDIAKENSFKVFLGLIYVDLSAYYYNLNNLEKSYINILKAKLLLEEVSDSEIQQYNELNRKSFLSREDLLEPVLFNIGVIAWDRGKLVDAKKYFNESLAFSKKKGDKQGQIDASINLASVFIEEKEFNKSIVAFEKIDRDFDLVLSDESLVNYNLAINYFELKDNDKSIVYINKAIKISEAIHDQLQLTDLYYFKAQIEKAKKKCKESIKLLRISLKKSIEIQDYFFQEKLYQELATCEIEMKNPEKANLWYQKMVIARDSLHIDNDDLYKRIDLEHKLLIQEVKSEQQSIIIKNEKERTKLLTWTIMFGILLFVTLIFLWITNKKNSNKREELVIQKLAVKEKNLENKRIEKEIKKKKKKEE